MKPYLLLLGLGCLVSSVSPDLAVSPASVSANDNIAWSKVVENPFDGKIIYDRNYKADFVLDLLQINPLCLQRQFIVVQSGNQITAQPIATTAIPVSFSQDSKDLEAAIDVFDANPFSRQFVVLGFIFWT